MDKLYTIQKKKVFYLRFTLSKLCPIPKIGGREERTLGSSWDVLQNATDFIFLMTQDSNKTNRVNVNLFKVN